MTRPPVLIVLMFVIACGPAMSSRTLTFDDVPAGTQLSSSSLYRDTYRVRFDSYFRAADHTGSLWGPPASGTNVMTCDFAGGYSPGLSFGHGTYSQADRDNVSSVAASFSTQADAVVRITAYYTPPSGTGVMVGSVLVGNEGETWSNHYVEIAFTGSSFTTLMFEGVNSPSDLQSFCLDDMTINYVPEPSSLFALAAGIGALGMVIRRRKH